MSQLNIHMTPEFERDLRKYMKIRHLHTKSEAIRTAIKEGLQLVTPPIKKSDFSKWIGLGKVVPTNKKTKFHSDDDLWK